MPDLIRAKPLREGLTCWLRSAAPCRFWRCKPLWAQQLQVQNFCWQPHKLARWPWASEEAVAPANTLVTALWGLSREGSCAMPRILMVETVRKLSSLGRSVWPATPHSSLPISRLRLEPLHKDRPHSSQITLQRTTPGFQVLGIGKRKNMK